MASAVGGDSQKRKREAEATKTLRTRFVFSNRVATPTVDIPAWDTPTLLNLLRIVGRYARLSHPASKVARRLEWSQSYSVKLLVQETSTSNHRLCHTSFITLDTSQAKDYRSWYRRNVELGTEAEAILAVEVRVDPLESWQSLPGDIVVVDSVSLSEGLKSVGEGRACLMPHQYVCIDFESLQNPYPEARGWPRGMRPLEEWHPVCIASGLDTNKKMQPCTSQFFPQRTGNDAARSGHHCDLCRVAAREMGLKLIDELIRKHLSAISRRELALRLLKEEKIAKGHDLLAIRKANNIWTANLPVHKKNVAAIVEDEAVVDNPEEPRTSSMVDSGWGANLAVHQKHRTAAVADETLLDDEGETQTSGGLNDSWGADLAVRKKCRLTGPPA